MSLWETFAMLLVFDLVFAACNGGESKDEVSSPTETPEATATEEPDLPTEAPTETAAVETLTPTEEPTAEPTEASGGEAPFIINAGDFFFEFPGNQGAVLEGASVRFRLDNIGQAPHRLKWYRDADYNQPIQGGDSGTVEGGASAEVTVTFDVAGSYFFRCEIHPLEMQGGIDAL